MKSSKPCFRLFLFCWAIAFGGWSADLASADDPQNFDELASFRYEDGQPRQLMIGRYVGGPPGTRVSKSTPIACAAHSHEATFEPVRGVVHAYGSLLAVDTNPAPFVDGKPTAYQTITFGQLVGDTFVEAVRIGIVDDDRASAEGQANYVPGAFDGRIEYYGMYCRPQTPYDFKLKIDLEQQRATAWVSGRGDDLWFPLMVDASVGGSMSIDQRDGWVVNHGSAKLVSRLGVDGSQAVNVDGQCYRAIGLRKSGKINVSLDLRYQGSGNGQFVQLYTGEPNTDAAVRMFEFGFDDWAQHLYAHGGAGGSQVQGSGGLPSEDEWITLWAVIDLDRRVADLGWCRRNAKPFVDGKRLSKYGISGAALEYLLLMGKGDDVYDNVYVGESGEHRDESGERPLRIDFERPRYPRAEITAINTVRVDQLTDAAGIDNLIVRSTPWPDGEMIGRHPFAKKDRTVGPGTGFKFQAMRSLWTSAERHVTVARRPNAANGWWLGFPDVVRTGAKSLVCVHNDGAGHGGGGPLWSRRSSDLGKTWSQATLIWPGPTNGPRLQVLRDGSLLSVADRHGLPYPNYFHGSIDGARSWSHLGTLDAAASGGKESCVPGRVTELADGSWLAVGSHTPGKAWKVVDGERLELYRSADRGKSWKLYSIITPPRPNSICEASIVPLPDGRLVLFARESGGHLPGVKTFSSDAGKTWGPLVDLPFFVQGRTCAGLLKDGRIFLTFRADFPGPPALWAWVGDADEKPASLVRGVHVNDRHSVGLKNSELHIDSDGALGQFTKYVLRPPDGPDSKVEVIVELKVVSNAGRAATLSVPFVGKLRFFPDRVELAHHPSTRVAVKPDEFHTYRVVSALGTMSLFVDGEKSLVVDDLPRKTAPLAWSALKLSPYALSFGNEESSDDAANAPKSVFLKNIPPEVTGYSIWRRLSVKTERLSEGIREVHWNAKGNVFPDQYQLDHLSEIQGTISGTDQGYSGWVELQDGRIFVVNYTDDTARWNCDASGPELGVSWIRGTYILPSDLSSKAE